MVQNTFKISRQQVSDVLGYEFSELEFSSFLKQIKTITPKVGLFWESATAEAGVYLILAGKVRLIDSDGNLVRNLQVGDSFGESTFFPDGDFEVYSARAGRNLELCYFPPELLFSLVQKYHSIQEHLFQEAQKLNSLFANSASNSVLVKSASEVVEDLNSNEPRQAKKINKAYFPNPSLKIGHLWQKVVRRYPFYAQQSSSDCGAACLVMVGRYWGKKFSVSRLRDIANVDQAKPGAARSQWCIFEGISSSSRKHWFYYPSSKS